MNGSDRQRKSPRRLGFVGAALALAGLLWSPAGYAAQDDDSANQAEEAAAEQGDALDVEAILDRPLDDEDYGESRMCIGMRSLDRIEVLDDSMVLFHGRRRGQLWLNQLASQCMGLTSDMIVETRTYGGNLCRLDRFRGRPRMGGIAITANCSLGSFESIAPEQAEALRVAVDERREFEARAKRAGKSN